MNSDKSVKQGIIQQLHCLSNRYDELLKLIDESENTIEVHRKVQKPWWTAFFKKDIKKRIK